jgi:hypothetical protein
MNQVKFNLLLFTYQSYVKNKKNRNESLCSNTFLILIQISFK